MFSVLSSRQLEPVVPCVAVARQRQSRIRNAIIGMSACIQWRLARRTGGLQLSQTFKDCRR